MLRIDVRGRVDAEGRRRAWIQEREGANRLVEELLFGLGQSVISEGLSVPEVMDLIRAAAKAHARREAAIADLAAAETLKVSGDLRLGIVESNARNEWKACDAGAVELDTLLRTIEEKRRDVEAELHRQRATTQNPDDPFGDIDRKELAERRALVDQQYAALRERAAALRAATIAAHAKLDQTIAARRQAAAAVTAGLNAHARDRVAADQQIRELTVEIGRAVAHLRLPQPAWQETYAHVARLEATIAERDRLIADVRDTIGRPDRRKLAVGAAILLAILATIGIALRMSLR